MANNIQIYLTRAKLFIGEHDGAERRFAAAVSQGRPTNAPAWIRGTLTYKLGIKDKSIVDLTPPESIQRTAEPEPVVDETGDEDAETGEGTDDEPDSSETSGDDAEKEQTKKSRRGGGKNLGLK